MPTYKVKPENDYPTAIAADSSSKKKKRYPTVSIPVSPEIIHALEVGGQVEVTLRGKVQALEMRKSSDNDPWNNRNELRVELRIVEAYPGEEAEDDDEDAPEPNMKDAIDKGLGYSK